MVPFGGCAGNQFPEESRKEQLGTQNHRGEGQVKIGALGNPFHENPVKLLVYLVPTQPGHRHESEEEHHGPKGSKEVHRAFPET